MRIVKTELDIQVFTDGVAAIYGVTNTAASGDKPRYILTKRFSLPFQDRKVGDVRFYQALQAGSEITRILRVPRVDGIQPGGDIVLINGDETQYRIEKVGHNVTLTNPPTMDLTLSLVKVKYEVPEEE